MEMVEIYKTIFGLEKKEKSKLLPANYFLE